MFGVGDERLLTRRNEPAPVLIVNADDFGLTDGVCRAVLTAHEVGVVTSTSALAVAPAFDRHAAALRDSGLTVGAHLCAVGEDPPLLTAREIPSLVDHAGRFPLTWQAFVARVATGRVDSDDLRREFSAQLAKLAGADLPLTHVDTHMNLHLWPQVTGVVLDLAARHGIDAIRLARSRGWTPTACGVRVLSSALARRATRAGFRFPATSTGLDETGSLDPTRVVDVVERLAATGAPTAELVAHIGEPDDPAMRRYRTRFRWSDELDAVCAAGTAAAIRRAGFRLGTFADLFDAADRAAAAPSVLPRPSPPVDLSAWRRVDARPVRASGTSPAPTGTHPPR